MTTTPNITPTKKWLSTKQEQPTEERYYIVLRSNSNPEYTHACHPAVHFWYANEKKWSSETEYWLADANLPELEARDALLIEREKEIERLKEANKTLHEVNVELQGEIDKLKDALNKTISQLADRRMLLGECDELLANIESDIHGATGIWVTEVRGKINSIILQ